MEFQQIRTKRFTIDLFDKNDIDQIYEYRKDPKVYESYSIKPESKEALLKYFEDNITEFNESNGYTIFVIRNENEIVGDIALSYWGNENKKNAIGYAINPKFQKQGYGYEAVKSVLDYLFKELNRNRIQAEVDEHNTASWKLLEKLGFVKEAVLREAEYYNGTWEDTFVYAMLKSDWEKSKI